MDGRGGVEATPPSSSGSAAAPAGAQGVDPAAAGALGGMTQASTQQPESGGGEAPPAVPLPLSQQAAGEPAGQQAAAVEQQQAGAQLLLPMPQNGNKVALVALPPQGARCCCRCAAGRGCLLGVALSLRQQILRPDPGAAGSAGAAGCLACSASLLLPLPRALAGRRALPQYVLHAETAAARACARVPRWLVAAWSLCRRLRATGRTPLSPSPRLPPAVAGPGGLPAGVVTPPGGDGSAASSAAAAAAAAGLLGSSPEAGLIAVSSHASLASSAATGSGGEGNKTLYLGNLHPFVTEATLQEVFAGLGGITELKVRRRRPA